MREKAIITMELEGRKIRVPEGLTVIEALWDTGHDVKRGIGCLSGLCGACTVAYLEKGAEKVRFGLGCQVVVTEGMNVIMLPYFPSRVAHYRLEEMEDPYAKLPEVYPELAGCTGCRACNVCPEWINVAEVMKKAKEGDCTAAAEPVMDCHMCGLCASRCPQSIAPQNVGLYLQRASARQRLIPPDLEGRLVQVRGGAFRAQWEEAAALDEEGLKDFCRWVREQPA
jgi:ferredoxin